MDLGLPPKPSRESLVAMCRDEPEKAADLILMLWDKVEQLAAKVEEQGAEIADLQAKLNKNSKNSSKPPSSDKHNPGGSPPKTDGKKKGRGKPGGQPGHKGATLERRENPDHIVNLAVPKSCSCGENLCHTPPIGERQRQVFDLPEKINIEVTEYRAPICQCPSCGKTNTATFPKDVKAPVQYGHRIRAVGTYLHVYHLLPFERLGEVFGDLFGCKLATGTLTNFIKDASARAAPVHEKIREEVILSDFMHNDETGLKILGKTSWLHVASTPSLAFFEVTAGRSFQDIKSVGVLEGYAGRSIHDFLPAYLKFEGLEHGLCNAHHLRDLTFIEEQYAQQWPVEMKALLLEIKKVKEREREGGRKVGAGTIARLQTRYAEILSKGRLENPEPEPIPKKRGRPARGKALNLLDRFTNYEDEVLAFLLHDVPFDNNEAERDLRMMKTRQKISGCFRSLEWSRRFAKIRSVIATGKKRSVSVYELLQQLFENPLEVEESLFGT